MKSKGTICMLMTPKIIRDFNNPDEDVGVFFDYHRELFDGAEEVVVVIGVGNSDQMLEYRGKKFWDDKVNWARYIWDDSVHPYQRYVFSDQTLNYHQISHIASAFKKYDGKQGFRVKVYDFFDQAKEFTYTDFKTERHPECYIEYLEAHKLSGIDIRSRLKADDYVYAAYPKGIPQGTLTADFIVNQIAQYLSDLELDGVLLLNQVGTRGRWFLEKSPGYSPVEAEAIRRFFRNLKSKLREKDLMWMDTYHTVDEEHDYWSVPREAYDYMDYISVSQFCVMVDSRTALRNIRSKIKLEHPKVLACVDYVDCWYGYKSYAAHSRGSKRCLKLEEYLVRYAGEVDGIWLMGHDEMGRYIPGYLLTRLHRKWEGALAKL